VPRRRIISCLDQEAFLPHARRAEGDIFGDECAFWSSATALEPPTASRTPASVVAASPCEVDCYVLATTSAVTPQW
jgi:hypothetical protein